MMKEIDLENMTGEEFEILCQEIFSKYFSVEVERTPLVGDGGKDLIIRFDEPAYVECKHHKSTVGRPVVQKLHSAMVTDWVKKGYIVTTGEFSPQAINHVKDNMLPIELIDGRELERMAAKVGIKIYFGYNVNLKELVIDKPSEESVKNHMQIIAQKFDAGSADLNDYYIFLRHCVSYKPYYAYDYAIDQDFYNSKKTILVGTIKESGTILLDAETLEIYSPSTYSFFQSGIFIPASESEDPPHYEPTHIRSDVEQKAYEGLTNLYTKNVSYTSTNGATYERKLSPSKKNIELSGFRMVYLPTVNVLYSTYSTPHEMEFNYNGNEYAEIKNDFIHGTGKSSASPMLCCSCGQLFCDSSLKQCSFCQRNVCSNCWAKYKAGIFKKRFVCIECKAKNPDLKYKS